MNEPGIAQAFQLAIQHHQAGRLAEAERLYQEILRQQPRHAHALYLLGRIAYQRGQFELALEHIAQAIESNPAVPEFHNDLGLIQQALNRQDKAIVSGREALRLRPDFFEARYNLGTALEKSGAQDEAVACYREALKLRPDFILAYNTLGILLGREGRFDEAVACYRDLLARNPAAADAHYNLGKIFSQQGRLEEAVASYQRALRYNPKLFNACYNSGICLGQLGRLEEALLCYQQALAIKPDFAEARHNLGNAYLDQGLPDQAATCFQQALALKPDLAEAYANLGSAVIAQGRPDAAIAYCQTAASLKPADVMAYDVELMARLYLAESAPDAVAMAHRRYAGQFEAPLRPVWPVRAEGLNPERRLKLGYVSPDFRQHSVACFIEPILAHHDSAAVEVYGYYCNTLHDEVTNRIMPYVDHWVECARLSDEEFAARIRADGIDILVDLAGHSRGNRLLTFARKPAPVQVTYLGYPATTGLSAIDYRLTTWDVDPAGNEAFHSERLIRLPRTLWCYRPPADMPAVIAPTPAMRRGFITFGSMNSVAKVSRETLAVWAEVLRAVPGARLVMTNVPEGSARERIVAHFTTQGIQSDRVMMYGKLPADPFRSVAGQIDIALDPFPYTGTTTTCEALWMGIPVITLIGQTSVSRSGYALLKTVGLTELCARDEADYVRIAVELARDLPRLNALRQGMHARLDASPLRDEAGLARDIEAAYRTMWREWCASGRG